MRQTVRGASSRHPKTGKWWCIDGTRTYGTMGQLVNHSSRPNLCPKVALVDGELRMGFLAARDIQKNLEKNTELLVDYGSQPLTNPWLSRRARVRVDYCWHNQFIADY